MKKKEMAKEEKQGEGINPAINRHLELQIKTLLQNAPRDPDKLERLLRIKEREKQEAMYTLEDTQRLVTEIEMLRVVLYLVNRNNRRNKASQKRGQQKSKKK